MSEFKKPGFITDFVNGKIVIKMNYEEELEYVIKTLEMSGIPSNLSDVENTELLEYCRTERVYAAYEDDKIVLTTDKKLRFAISSVAEEIHKFVFGIGEVLITDVMFKKKSDDGTSSEIPGIIIATPINKGVIGGNQVNYDEVDEDGPKTYLLFETSDGLNALIEKLIIVKKELELKKL